MRQARWLVAVVLVVASGLAACAPTPPPATSPIRANLAAVWRDAGGQLRWPPNDGCADAEKPATLPPGARIDRYGSDHGQFFAVPGTPYQARALPYDPAKLPYTVYVVRQPLPVQECTIAPWFGEPGGGEQFKTAEPAAQLTTEGVIAPE